MRTKISSLLMISSLVLGGCAGNRPRLQVGSTVEGEVVEAKGMCPIVEDKVSARKCALAEAQKGAVEKVLGVFISARTRVEKALVIEQNILAKTDGYIKTYEIIEEHTKAKFYHVTIRALIPPKNLEADVKRLLKSTAVGNPRVAVMLDELVDGDVTDRLQATQALTEALLDRGFRVVDREVLAQANAMAQIKAIESGDVNAVNNLAKALKAEVLLVGRAEAMFNTDEGLGGLVSYRATVTVQAVKAGSGEIVKSASKTMSGVDLNKAMAADKARVVAAEKVANKLIDGLIQSLAAKAALTVTIKGLTSLAQLTQIQKKLQSIPGVDDLFTRSYDGGVATLDLDISRASATEVASALERIQSPKIKVEEIYKDRLAAKVLP